VLVLLTLLAAAPTDGVPPAARARYQDAMAKLNARQYGPANDILNALAGEHPRVAEIFASRCSAQLGLQHWAAAEADCSYTLALKQLPTAVYGLAVAEDGLGKYEKAIAHYRQYAGLLDATAELKAQALNRADLLAPQVKPVKGAAPAPGVKAVNVEEVAPPPPPPPAKQQRPQSEAPPPPPPPGGGKGQFVPGIPDPNEGLLYVYRHAAQGPASTTLVVDRTRIGELWNDRYFEVRVHPGNHEIVVKQPTGRDQALSIEVSEGEVEYVRLDWAGDSDGYKPTPVGKVGRKEIRQDCELVYSKKL
jgi:hypothetical protein